ncbi:MAG: hypothetical protein QMD09_12825 [Desulfatibacillaceae bacterium]|nr:hypothetical protein [Desulfatibacillaceae bacterium]
MENSSPVHLCQADGAISCGACCGLYNVVDSSQENLENILLQRTLLFEQTPRTADSIDSFGRKIKSAMPRGRPYKEFHHCPFLGLVGQSRQRVGCLLHPLSQGNENTDWRGLSWYGALACRTYFCPSHHKLADSYKLIVRAAADNWYLYGLVITETDFLESFFGQVEKLLGRKLDYDDSVLTGLGREAAKAFLNLKLAWPFRRKNSALAHYFFSDGLYAPPLVIYPDHKGPAPVFDAIFRALHSDFKSGQEVKQAIEIVEGLAGDFAKILCR